MQIISLSFLLAAITLATADSILPTNSVLPRAPPVEAGHERRGIAFNNPNFVRYFAVEGTHATWCYNWDSATSRYDAWYKYVPMLHSLREEHTDPWLVRIEKAAKLDEQDPTFVLTFNEPDICDIGSGGTCISVQEAVAGWRKWIEPLHALKPKMYLGSPAVSNVAGQQNKGLDWLSQFMNTCSGCQIDFINVHWYGGADQHQEFKDHIDNVRKFARDRPIWVTEFKPSGTDEEIMSFLDEVLPWMDDSRDIHRYAYFMARPGPGLLINEAQTNMSDIGAHYNFHHLNVHPQVAGDS